jgi:hypothetical protein
MDKVRFGRALGYGARHAAKAVAQALDAATTPDPRPVARRPTGASPVAGGATPAERVTVAAGRVIQAHQAIHAVKAEAVRQVAAEVKVQGRSMGRGVWSPVARLSSVLWLGVTGTFFTVLALYLSQGLWKQRGAIRLPVTSAEAGKYYVHLLAFGVFLYFAVSSFVRARRRGRRM